MLMFYRPSPAQRTLTACCFVCPYLRWLSFHSPKRTGKFELVSLWYFATVCYWTRPLSWFTQKKQWWIFIVFLRLPEGSFIFIFPHFLQQSRWWHPGSKENCRSPSTVVIVLVLPCGAKNEILNRGLSMWAFPNMFDFPLNTALRNPSVRPPPPPRHHHHHHHHHHHDHHHHHHHHTHHHSSLWSSLITHLLIHSFIHLFARSLIHPIHFSSCHSSHLIWFHFTVFSSFMAFCSFIPFHISSSRVMLYHVMSFHVISVQVVSCYLMPCHVMSFNVMSWHVMSCHFMSFHVILCHFMSCHCFTSCHVMSCPVMPCHFIRLIHLILHSVNYVILSFIRSFVPSFLHSLIYSFIYLFLHLFHSCIHHHHHHHHHGSSFLYGWCFQPLWKIWLRQLGEWNSQYMGKYKMMFQTTNLLLEWPELGDPFRLVDQDRPILHTTSWASVRAQTAQASRWVGGRFWRLESPDICVWLCCPGFFQLSRVNPLITSYT